jgi:hypothetical protein
MEQLLNQEVARLRHAELLRNASRRHVIEKDPTELTVAVHGLRARFARLVHHTPSAPAVRAGAR